MGNLRIIMQQIAEIEMTINKDNLYDYNVIDGLYVGVCKILHITYNPAFKSFDLVLEDIDTHNTLCVSRCDIYLKRRT